jgi:hypothetical protein
MKNLYFFPLLGLLFLGAGCASATSQTVQDSTSVSNESLQADEIIQIEQVDTTTYAMSSDIVLFAAPENWFVRQADAGGGSVITIQASKDDEEGMDILVANPWPNDGVEVTYEEWLATYSFAESLGSRVIGGYTFSQYEGEVNGEALTAYTATIDEERPIYIKIQVRTELLEVTDVLDSIVFFPSEEAQSSAQPIPEWALADRE